MSDFIATEIYGKKYNILKCPCGRHPELIESGRTRVAIEDGFSVQLDDVISPRDSDRKSFWFSCEHDDCERQPTVFVYSTVGEAVAAWNAGVLNLPQQFTSGGRR